MMHFLTSLWLSNSCIRCRLRGQYSRIHPVLDEADCGSFSGDSIDSIDSHCASKGHDNNTADKKLIKERVHQDENVNSSTYLHECPYKC